MQTVVILIHLMIVLAMVGLVLIQKSEGGGLGMGGAVLDRRQAAPAARGGVHSGDGRGIDRVGIDGPRIYLHRVDGR